MLAGCACVLGVASAVYGYGCGIYDTSLLLPGTQDAGADGVAVDAAAGDARDGARDSGPGPCPLVEPPAKPAMDDPSDAGDQTFVVALHTIELFGDGGAAEPIGYDLDKVFTCCDGGPESCKAIVTGATHCDDLGGRDNSGGQLLSTLASLDPSQFNTSSISNRLQTGQYSILMQILHYNGQPNDTQVTAGLYASLGVPGDAGALWNGQDSWSLDQSFVVTPDASPILPTHFDGNAYVSGGTLVIHVNFPITIGATSGSTFSINLTAGVLTGVLTPESNGTYALKAGQIAGRWNISDLLVALQSINYLGMPICQGTSTYTFIKSQICQYADIMTDPTLDLTGASCNAISLGVAFTADPALLGAVNAPIVKNGQCGDAAPTPDNCP